MTEPDPRPARPRPARIAVSPIFGPVPFISVPVAQPAPAPEEATMPGIPAGWRYSPDHLWACLADGGNELVRVGVTDFAQRSLGDITGVTLPNSGDTVTVGQACGTIESGIGVTDLIAPVTGTVRARNDDLADAPGLINTDPYGHGWMIEVQTDPASLSDQLAGLMDAAAYRELTGA